MTREEAKQWIPILQAYSEGKDVQFRRKGSQNNWLDTPLFDPESNPELEWRIKPEAKYRPWKPEEVPVGKVIINKAFNSRWVITGCDNTYVQVGTRGPYTINGIFDKFIMEDGSPCGVLENK